MTILKFFIKFHLFFVPEHACGVRWNDLAFGIVWPVSVGVISLKDQQYADYL